MAGQTNNAGALKAVGKVQKATGTVEVIHPDGTRGVLHVGDPVYQGDTISTGGDGSIGIEFADSSTFGLGKAGRMIIDELVYDPDTQTGQSAMSVLKGAFALTSGQIAKSAPDAATLKTPVMTIGIRGTSVAGIANVEGEQNTITLLQDPNGSVGQIMVTTAGGTMILNQPNFQTTVFSFSQPPSPPTYTSPSQINSLYGDALQSHPNPPSPSTAPPPPSEQPQPPQQQQPDASGSPQGDTGTTGNMDNPIVGYQTVVNIVTTRPETLPVLTQLVTLQNTVSQTAGNEPQAQTQPNTRFTPGEDRDVIKDQNELPDNAAPTFHGRGVAVTYMNSTTAVSGTIEAIDPEAGTVTLTVPTTSTHGGTVTYDAAYGTWSYVPAIGFYGVDTVTVTAKDGSGDTAQYTLRVYVNQSVGSSPSIQGPMDFIEPDPGEWYSLAGQSTMVQAIDDSTYVQAQIELDDNSDGSSGLFRITIGGVTTTFSGTLYVAGTVEEVNQALATLEYKGGAGESDYFTISVTDGSNTDSYGFSVNVAPESIIGDVTNGATMAVLHDTTVTGNIYNQSSGRLQIDTDVTLALADGNYTFENWGVLWGDGTLELGASTSFWNKPTGTIRPGDGQGGSGDTADGNNEIGSLVIDASASGASIQLFSGSTIEIEYDGSTSHDTLRFVGTTVSLSGKLSLDVDPTPGSSTWGYAPEALIENVDSGTWFESVELASGSNSKAIIGVWLDGSNVMGQSSLFSSGTATYTGSTYDETVFGATGLMNSITGGQGNDIITGGNLADTLIGGDGDDLLKGGTGADTLTGGSGNDLLYGDADNDILNVESDSVVTIDGGDGTDILNWTGTSQLYLTSGQVSGIEVLKLTGTGEVWLDEGTISDITTSTGTDFYIMGSGDLRLTNYGWSHSPGPVLSADMDNNGTSESYRLYSSNGTNVYIATDTNVQEGMP